MVPIKATWTSTATCESRGTKANQSSNNELQLTMLIVFTFTLRDITKIYTVYKTPTWVCGRKWNISLSGIPKPLNQSLELRERRLRRGPLLFRKWGLVNIHGWAGTNQVLISIDVINPGNGWPEFVFWFHEGLQGTKDRNLPGYSERFLSVGKRKLQWYSHGLRYH